MSLPQRLYQLYREVVGCELVKTRQATPENMLQFQNLLNKAFPENEVETHQRALVRSMYNSSPVGFSNYVYQNRSRVGALVLWTESRCLANFFRLSRVVHISFNESTQQYAVVLYIPRQHRQRRETTALTTTSTTEPGTHRTPEHTADQTQPEQLEQLVSRRYNRAGVRERYFSRTPRILRNFHSNAAEVRTSQVSQQSQPQSQPPVVNWAEVVADTVADQN